MVTLVFGSLMFSRKRVATCSIQQNKRRKISILVQELSRTFWTDRFDYCFWGVLTSLLICSLVVCFVWLNNAPVVSLAMAPKSLAPGLSVEGVEL